MPVEGWDVPPGYYDPDPPEDNDEWPDERDAFEAWADADSRQLDPQEFEERTPDNNHYYRVDSTNHAYIGWCARARRPTGGL